MGKTFMYVSSWTHGKGEAGIGLFELDNATGALTYLGKEITGADFNVTLFDKERRLFYALNETDNLPNLRSGGGGRIFVFRADPATGHLTQLSCTPTWCSKPAYLAIDPAREYMVVVHHASRNTVNKIKKDAFGKFYPVVEYDDSTIELFSMNRDGTVGELLDVVYHYGCGPEKRQTNAHPHSCAVSPSGKLFAVCDKGNDTLSMYMIDKAQGKLILADVPVVHAPATLPRYGVYHPVQPYYYHNNENCMDLHGFRYSEEGKLEPIGAWSSLPDGYSPERVTEETRRDKKVFEQQALIINAAGSRIYDVVRGADTVAVFAVNEQSGSLEKLQDVPVDGVWPRGIGMTPDEKYAAVCCVTSGEIIMYRVDENGLMQPTGHRGKLECAAYATFWQP